MTAKVPVRAVFSGSNVIGLSEYQSGETIDNVYLTNSGITLVDDSSSTTTISLGESLKIAGSGVSTTISGDTLTISLSSGIDATKIADGSISNTEFQHLNGASSNIQNQLDAKASRAFAIAQAVALG